ncbi:BLUF domain-containing protein [Ectothiorhodospiraceae bacterium BW-2]|nr:BLUF domain-containing protein [Ectothiorhodospiraceae bacterium BW-2]
MLYQIIYVSTASREMPTNQLADILQQAREKNSRLGISGILLYNRGTFIQVLEGERAVLSELLRTIEHDTRHYNLITIDEAEIEQRDFPEWSMGFGQISDSQLESLEGINDFMQTGELPATVHGAIRDILDDFR